MVTAEIVYRHYLHRLSKTSVLLSSASLKLKLDLVATKTSLTRLSETFYLWQTRSDYFAHISCPMFAQTWKDYSFVPRCIVKLCIGVVILARSYFVQRVWWRFVHHVRQDATLELLASSGEIMSMRLARHEACANTLSSVPYDGNEYIHSTTYIQLSRYSLV